jgi:hypothetical protein
MHTRADGAIADAGSGVQRRRLGDKLLVRVVLTDFSIKLYGINVCTYHETQATKAIFLILCVPALEVDILDSRVENCRSR